MELDTRNVWDWSGPLVLMSNLSLSDPGTKQMSYDDDGAETVPVNASIRRLPVCSAPRSIIRLRSVKR